MYIISCTGNEGALGQCKHSLTNQCSSCVYVIC